MRAQGLVGKWAWSVNGKSDGTLVTFNENGTCTATNGASCKWRKAGSNFEITWNHGGFVDVMSLSADGKTISGKNKQGDSILGQRR